MLHRHVTRRDRGKHVWLAALRSRRAEPEIAEGQRSDLLNAVALKVFKLHGKRDQGSGD